MLSENEAGDKPAAGVDLRGHRHCADQFVKRIAKKIFVNTLQAEIYPDNIDNLFYPGNT